MIFGGSKEDSDFHLTSSRGRFAQGSRAYFPIDCDGGICSKPHCKHSTFHSKIGKTPEVLNLNYPLINNMTKRIHSRNALSDPNEQCNAIQRNQTNAQCKSHKHISTSPYPLSLHPLSLSPPSLWGGLIPQQPSYSNSPRNPPNPLS